MTALLAIFLLVVMIASGSALISRRHDQLTAISEEARRQHLRSGEYPAVCSWCRNTTLARRLFVLERSERGWEPVDLLATLAACAPHDIEPLSKAFLADTPRWRRLCTERCLGQLLASLQVKEVPEFLSCDHCSTRIPAVLQHCNACGARTQAAAPPRLG